MALAEAEILERYTTDDDSYCSATSAHSDVPPQNKVDHMKEVQKYVDHQPNVLPVEEHFPQMHAEYKMDAAQDISRYLLKKDLLMSRLVNYNDKPETYRAWKSSFQSVARDLIASPAEEMDLLIKYLGPESMGHAITLRSVYTNNPTLGCSKIWVRLDERYGSPELTKNAVMTKLNRLRISGKDPKQFYEMVDVLAEIEALKCDPKYSLQLAYFDSSEGVLPIVHKLPHNLQERWVSRAATYKKNNHDLFPPFSLFVEFINEIAKIKNDPALICSVSNFDKPVSNTKFEIQTRKTEIARADKTAYTRGTLSVRSVRCPIHKASHSLPDCRSFKEKSLNERKKIVKEGGVCFRCLETCDHRASNCKENVSCNVCGSAKHISLMHDFTCKQNDVSLDVQQAYGGERSPSLKQTGPVKSSCTQICGTSSMGGRSCAKIVLVDVFCSSSPSNRLRTYAILDDQSNRSLAMPKLFKQLNIDGDPFDYTLHSCSGPSEMSGRKAFNCVVEAIDGTHSYRLPPLLECPEIPNARDEIPTSEIASLFPHLQNIASQIPALNDDAEILLLLGRDLSSVHHVHDQIIGSDDAPFAQRLGLGWVIVGQVCLGSVHHADDVNCNKTYLLPSGRTSLFQPCSSNLKVVENLEIPGCSGFDAENLFVKTKHDDEVGMSVEDREFLDVMKEKMKKDPSGNWIAPLPFRHARPKLPNNRSYAFKRAMGLHNSLLRDSDKSDHFVTFMDQIISRGHAEIATTLSPSEECWYLPLFGVYHPKKPGQIRGVFDASAKFKGVSLNDVLLQGPDLLNNLLGILLRFRKDEVAISADIEKMFYSFLVEEKDRDFLRFFWYAENDPSKDLVEYRMRVHVFGNSPSPAVANFGLCKTAEVSESIFGTDVRNFVSNNFYVDDGLTSAPTKDEAIDLMKRTQTALQTNGGIRLHKVASNCEEVMTAFPQEDLAKDLANLDLSKDDLPLQRSLGLLWNLKADCFTFQISSADKPFTRRGVLSVVNSLYDPIGIVAPVTITGKILLKAMTTENGDWDEPLPESYLAAWKDWTESLQSLQHILLPRTYFNHSISQGSPCDLLIFSDASEKAIASCAYIVSCRTNQSSEIGFVMGKAKVAPSKGHSIPRLELCAAVLSVEVADFVVKQLDVKLRNVRYFTDSKVVLGYISNRTRRFYTYVSHRVQRILNSSDPSQWSYVDTKSNPADVGTRGVSAPQMGESIWLKGPPEKLYTDLQDSSFYPLQAPKDDKEVRPEVTVMTTKAVTESHCLLGSHRFERFSSWKSVSRAVGILQHISKSFNKTCACSGWHICRAHDLKHNIVSAQNLVVRVYQMETYKDEILDLKHGKPLSQNSTIISLNPFLDEHGILRVGGRIKHSDLPTSEKNPTIISGKTHLATLLIQHFHEQVLHQGRHFTEGAIRSGGFWIIGGKRRISSLIFSCFICRRLRGKQQNQLMADLPADRVNPAPPFSYVGVDVFGPWSVVVRKTRGGEASSKRWGVLFTCLSIRAVHIELVSEMSSSAFINALRRFISIRGDIVEIRSDRGTNFVGSCEDLGFNAVNVEDRMLRSFLSDKRVNWVFNPPHSSHMGGVWERMIGVVRRILDALLLNSKNLTHDVLATFMAEVCAIVNARPIVPVSSDSEVSEILSPSALLTQKLNPPSSFNENLSLKDIYRAEWKRVQVLSDQFWCRWRSEYLTMFQSRRKWLKETQDLKKGDVVLMKDEAVCRNQWPLAVIQEAFPSSDSKVRSVEVKLTREGKPTFLTRPITELVLLLSE